MLSELFVNNLNVFECCIICVIYLYQDIGIIISQNVKRRNDTMRNGLQNVCLPVGESSKSHVDLMEYTLQLLIFQEVALQKEDTCQLLYITMIMDINFTE